VTIADLNKVDVGMLAKVVAETKTASRGEVPPSLNLVLDHPRGMIEQGDITALRAASASGSDGGREPFGDSGSPEES
jgi:hypothetical protein